MSNAYIDSLTAVSQLAQEVMAEKEAIIQERDEEISNLKSIIYRSAKYMRHSPTCEDERCRCGFDSLKSEIYRVVKHPDFPKD